MHLLRLDQASLDATAEAVDLDLAPAEVLVLSAADSDLTALAGAWEALPPADRPGLRLASLLSLRHPFSVDLLIEKTARHARLVLVRLLGGPDYWRYGVDELAAAARRHGFALAFLPGDDRPDPRLDNASTLAATARTRLAGWFRAGGPDNLTAALGFLSGLLGRPLPAPDPVALPAFAPFPPATRTGMAGQALILFYRSHRLAADTAPVTALADALAARGLAVQAASVTSLKDPAVIAGLAPWLAELAPDVILNTTGFSARREDGAGVLDQADCPVLQAILSGSSRDAWAASKRGLSATDLAMQVVLPESDGRLIARAIAFKDRTDALPGLDFAPRRLVPAADGLAFTADLAAGWVTLRRTPAAGRRLALVLSDYPAKGGRAGYAVGLDTPASTVAVLEDLAGAGATIGTLPDAAALMRRLESDPATEILSLAGYESLFAGLDPAFRAAVTAQWGAPETDPLVTDGAFRLRLVRCGSVVIALQPDRGRRGERKALYHDPERPPAHGYIAFHLWLRHVERVHALVQLGTHGTAEWLPGNAVALSPACAPGVVTGPLPVIYPFIVTDPGEAAAARRRLAAALVGHLTPPLRSAGGGATADLEALFDDYAAARGLDPRRADRIATAIRRRADETGLSADLALPEDPADMLAALDQWLCDLKELRIGDGLHVFGRADAEDSRGANLAALAESAGTTPDAIAARVEACAPAERAGLAAALAGRFVAPGPSGTPARGRLDVLPTGRNLHGADPRALPTATAWEMGRQAADAVIARHLEQEGDWPRAILMDLWGSATLRTGGEDIAQALALLGVRPLRDSGSDRVNGFEILPPAVLGRPRVDVTLRVSGLFRDVFPGLIALFDAAVQALAARDDEAGDNPLSGVAGPARVFGPAPGAYGIGIAERLLSDDDVSRADLGDDWLAASAFALSGDGRARPAAEALAERVAAADAFVRLHDLAGRDLLDADTFAEHIGGFSAAAGRLGAAPVLYHVDATRPGQVRVRTVPEEIVRLVRGRLVHPGWIAGMKRHGHRGAGELAESVDALMAFASLTEAVPPHLIQIAFDALLGDADTRAFLMDANPAAARAIAERFEAGLKRGQWHIRRNSDAAVLSGLLARAEDPA